MNIGGYTCLTLAIIFGIMTIIFLFLKDKGAMLISGFNSLSKSERALYDISKLCKDQRNSLFIWTIIMCIGAIISFFISQYFAIVSFIVWLIVFFKDVHYDTDKAFGKYKINKY